MSRASIQAPIVEKTEIEDKFSITYIDSLEFESDGVLQKVQKRAKRNPFSIYNEKHNRWMNNLYAKDLRAKKEIGFFLNEVNPLVGYGVFAKNYIPTLSYIGEYAGELRKRRRNDKGNDYIFGYMVGMFGTPWIIDAKKRGNFTRFLNHSYQANVSSRGIVVDGIYRVIFFANTAICKGQQLTYDYGPTYWRSRPYPQTI